MAASYDYDPLGRRAGKSGAGVATEEYLSDGVEEIADHDGAGNILRRYIHGPGIDEPVVMVSYNPATGAETGRQYYHADYAGSIIAMSDGATGAITDIYTYSAFGEVGDPSGNPFRYTGRRLDAETGLYYYRSRYYSSAIGRFLQTDPIGYGDNMNMYAYVGNDPVNAIDPSGKCAVIANGEGKKVQVGLCGNDRKARKLVAAQLSDPHSIASQVEAKLIADAKDVVAEGGDQAAVAKNRIGVNKKKREYLR